MKEKLRLALDHPSELPGTANEIVARCATERIEQNAGLIFPRTVRLDVSTPPWFSAMPPDCTLQKQRRPRSRAHAAGRVAVRGFFPPRVDDAASLSVPVDDTGGAAEEARRLV